jgi:putative ABC transport system permease protein
MRPLVDDLRFGLRLLWRHPGFTALALLTLGVGIGANTAVFSFIEGVLLRPLPYAQPDQLVWIGGREARFSNEVTGISVPDLLDLAARNRTLDAVAGYAFFSERLIVTGAGEAEQADGIRVTANFFDVLGVRPAVGRSFRSGEDQRGGPRVAVLSHSMWMSRYGGNPQVLGSNIILNSVPHEVVGVMPAGFEFPLRVDVWVPALIGHPSLMLRDARSFLAVARTRRQGAALADLDRISQDLERQFVTTNTGYRFALKPLQDHVSGGFRDTLGMLAVTTLFLLLIACANIANLLLARATARYREMAVREALGASRGDLLRQLLMESLLLAFFGAVAGVLLAWWVIGLVKSWNPAGLPRLSEVSLNVYGVCFAAFLAAATAVLFGLAPALQAARNNQHEALKESGSRGSSESGIRGRVRNLLVAAEVALAIALLAGAGLLLESMRRLEEVNPGFDAQRVMTAELAMPGRKFRSLDAMSEFVDRFLERARSLPGVVQAGASLALPMGSVYTFLEFRIVGDPPQAFPPMAGNTSITPGYIEAMGIRLRSGRLFTAADNREAPPVVLISEPMARQYFAGRDPVGRRLRLNFGSDPNKEWEIVGVIGGVRHESLAGEERVELYMPFAQQPYPVANFVVKTAAPPAGIAAPLRQALRELDREMVLFRMRTMEDLVAESANQSRARGWLTALFACIALLLASLGIYGVMSYAVSRRTQEIGIRMALGATPGGILRMIVSQSSRLVLLGLAAGLVLTLALGRMISSLLYQVSAFDGKILAAVSLLLILVAITATSIPAWRAARIDPLRALRQE